MNGFIGVTDNEWFAFLSRLPEIDEVNFWQPSGRSQFRALRPGEPFLFKLHAPHHFCLGRIPREEWREVSRRHAKPHREIPTK
jgi:putative restriction endonuclease